MTQRPKINWTNTLFLTLSPAVGIIGTALLCWFSHVPWQTWVLAAAMLVAGGFSITAGYHRLFAHKTYVAAWPVRLFFILFGSATFEGSVIEWSTDHRDHHRFTDTDKDPYSVTVSAWHAHIGWLIRLDPSKRHYSNINDLKKSWLLRLQHHYFVPFCITMGLILPTAIAALWGDALGGFIVAGALRIAASHHGTFCINSLCHLVGKRTYSNDESARDNWMTAFLTFGEGYHNYHHKFPADYRNGVRFYQFDPTKWIIRSLAFVGLAKDLRRVSPYRIIQAKIENNQILAGDSSLSKMLSSLQESMLNTINKLREFESEYAQSRSKEYRRKIKNAQSELRRMYQEWKQLRLEYFPAS